MGVDVHVDIFVDNLEDLKVGMRVDESNVHDFILKLDHKTTLFVKGEELTREILTRLVSDFNQIVGIKVDQGEK